MTNIHNHLNWLSLPSSFLTPRLPAAAAAAAAELLLELDSRLPVLPLPAPHIHALPIASESLHCKPHARIIKCPSSSASWIYVSFRGPGQSPRSPASPLSPWHAYKHL